MVCGMKADWNCGVFYPAALVIVKEVANHANDIMKQGVSAKEEIRRSFNILVDVSILMPSPLFFSLFLIPFQDIFQKLFQVQSRLTGHHEIVQPGRVKIRGPYVSIKFLGHFTVKATLCISFSVLDQMMTKICSSPQQDTFMLIWCGLIFVLQVFLKEGVLNKLSRKVMQPRMFFLV